MHHPTDGIAHTTAFVAPVVVHWLERDIALRGNNLSVYMVFFRFFEKNPSGRILNRFSADVIAVDQVSVFLSSDFFERYL